MKASHKTPCESRMREIRTSGLMRGKEVGGHCLCALIPWLPSLLYPSPRRSQRRRAAARSPWRVDLCLARALLATPFGPSAMCFLRPTRVFGWLDPNTNSETADTRPEITPPNNRPDYAQPILNSPFCQLCSPTHSAPLWQTLSFLGARRFCPKSTPSHFLNNRPPAAFVAVPLSLHCF